MNKLISTLCLSLVTGMILVSCGSNPGKETTATAPAQEVAGNNEDDLKKKMEAYVQVINEVNGPLNKGYRYYLNYVNPETGGSYRRIGACLCGKGKSSPEPA